MRPEIFCLVDVNNAYCNFETFWNPKLVGKKLIILSSNDASVIARSKEVKALGTIKMGVPLFQIASEVQKHDIKVLSSNFALYGEMSRRFHSVVEQFCPPGSCTIYSIDENFINLSSLNENYDLDVFCSDLKKRILDWLDLSVGMGVGLSRTQAKISSHIAKTNPKFNGQCNMANMDLIDIEALYSNIPVGEVWGIGSKLNKKLNDMGISTVFDLAIANPHRMRDLFGVNMQNTILELLGISCIKMDVLPQPKQQIISSRSFGNKVTELHHLKEAMAKYVQDAVRRLRKDNSICGSMIVFVQSSPFDKTKPYYSKSFTYTFPQPTDNVLEMVSTATKMLNLIFRPGVDYKKCGVMLVDITQKDKQIYDLLTDYDQLQRDEDLMNAYEAIQARFGKKKIAVGSCHFKDRFWTMKSQNVSQNFFSSEGMLTFN